MSRLIKSLFTCILLWTFGGLDGQAREVPITILHTTDLHGHMLPAYDYDGNENVGGLLRCASLIRKLRAREQNVHLVDCGDLIQGGAESFATDGRIMLDALEWLKYDAWVIGNHEFDWGIDNLEKLIEGTTLNTLGGNIHIQPTAKNPLPKVKAFVVKEIEGVRIVYVGLTTPGIPAWSRPYLLGPTLFKSSVESLKEIMPKVRKTEPDIQVLLLHQGYKSFGDDHANEINQIVKAFPEFDLIIGGHSHRVVESVKFKQTLYTQAGYHGNWLGKVDLVFDTVQKKVVEKKAQVFTIGDTYELDPELYAQFKDRLEATKKIQNQIIGESESALISRAAMPGQSPQQDLISRAILEGTGADIVMHGALDDRSVTNSVLREKDVWKVVPYENAIGIVSLNVKEMKEILEENARRTKSVYFMGVLGICYDLDATAAEGHRVKNIRLPNGRKIHPRKKFKVALNSYVLASGGRRMNRLREIAEQPSSQLRMLKLNTRDLVRAYIKKHSPLKLPGDHCVSRHKVRD